MSTQFLNSLENVPKSRKQRLFEAGHLKLLVLHLIYQSPKHGYEIIKDIGEIVGNGYTPSAGTIYPTLNYLEEMNYITVQNMMSARKQYVITDQGDIFLNKESAQLKQILERFEVRRKIHHDPEFVDIFRAMENLKAALRLKLNTTDLDSVQVREIADKIDQAAVAITRLSI